MKIQTYSILVGGTSCNCDCPRCVSKMTPDLGMKETKQEVNWRNFRIGCKFAKDSGVSTVLLTGKGEPTMYPDLITQFVDAVSRSFLASKWGRIVEFPFIELQTNGFLLTTPQYRKHLSSWYEGGLTTVALSIVHHIDNLNIKGMRPKNPMGWNLIKTISLLHDIGFSVRISCIMENEYTDSWKEVEDLIRFSKENRVEQLTIRGVEMPTEHTENKMVSDYVYWHKIDPQKMEEIRKHLTQDGKELLHLIHGAIVFDYNSQNVCLTNCLTLSNNTEEVRQLIFFPDGHLRYDWVYPGAILL